MKAIIFVFGVLACATLAGHAMVNRYAVRGADLLTGGWAAKQKNHSTADITGNSLILTAADAGDAMDGGGVHVLQDVPGALPGMVVKLSADLKCEDVRPGKKGWHRPRLLLVQNDGKKDRWDWPHQVAAFSKSRDWERHDMVFYIAPETRTVRVTAQISKAAGVFYLKNISLVPVGETQVFSWVKKTMLTAWGGFFVLLVGGCMYRGHTSRAGRVLVAAAAFAIIAGTTMPAEMKTRVSDSIKTHVHVQNDTVKAAVPWDITKVGHFGFFGLFGLMIGLMMRSRPMGEKMVFILLLAGSTEIAQYFIEGRSPLFTDFLIDLAGGFIGIFSIPRAASPHINNPCQI